MDRVSGHGLVDRQGLLQIEDCLDADGGIVLPAGVTLISLIDRNIANVGDAVAYRYLDYSRSADGEAVEAHLDSARSSHASHRCPCAKSGLSR